MRLKLDENLPRRGVHHLGRLGHDVHTVHDEGLEGRPTRWIWEAAQSEGRFLVTLDLGFGNIQRYPPGSHHGILLLRVGDLPRESIADRLAELFVQEDITSWSGALVVATETKVRVRTAPMPRPWPGAGGELSATQHRRRPRASCTGIPATDAGILEGARDARVRGADPCPRPRSSTASSTMRACASPT